MTMTIDHNQRRFGSLHFEHMSSYSGHPHFTDPWAPSPSTAGPSPASQSGSQQSLYINNHQDGAGLPHLNLAPLPKHPQHSSRAGSSTSMAPYGALQVSAASADHLLGVNRLQHQTTSAAYDTSAYTSTASPVNATYTSSSSPYDQLGYAQASMRGSFALGNEDSSRRYSQQSLQQDDRRSFQDALEASHGMLSMSQETPRNIFDVRNRGRGSGDSYGFPPTHSATSSVSSTGFSGYYAGSVDGSVSDYSTAGSDIESLSSRTLPRPQGLMASAPPAPQSMMGSFSSKVSSSTQKKHKCKVCDKRFTRPSSLQTHMYSHTGEKPFACEVEGCGRNFSVVSNLRRHRKVHKNQTQGETPSETGSEEHQSP